MDTLSEQNIDYKNTANILRANGVIIYPTDTAYAIGCDARDDDAVRRVFEIKGREQAKVLPLIAADIDMVRNWCELSGQAEELAERYWPGPLTLVLPVKKQGLAVGVASKDDCVAVRVPDCETARSLSKEIGAPIVSTSANKSGGKNPYSIEQVRASLGKALDKIERVIDIGVLPERPVSTVVKVCDNKVEVIRQGAIVIPSPAVIPRRYRDAP